MEGRPLGVDSLPDRGLRKKSTSLYPAFRECILLPEREYFPPMIKTSDFNQTFLVGCCLTHKAFDDLCMVLTQHGGYRIPFGGELKQSEKIFALTHFSVPRYINVRKFVNIWIFNDLKNP